MARAIFILFISVCCCSVFVKCRLRANVANNTTNATVEISSFLAFVTLHISYDSLAKSNKVELVNFVKTQAKMKHQNTGHANSENKLLIYYYENERLKDSVFLPHPLYKRVEYLANDGKTFSNKSVQLAQADFFFRMAVQGNEVKFVILEKLKNKETKLLKTIKL